MSSTTVHNPEVQADELTTVDQKFRLLKLIGDGLQSKVYLSDSLHKITDRSVSDGESEDAVETFALKIFDKDNLKHLALQEFKTMKVLGDHQNILKVYNYYSEGNFTPNHKDKCVFGKDKSALRNFDYMSMEFCQNGDLFDLVKSTGKLPGNFAKYLFLQLLDAVEHLHTKG